MGAESKCKALYDGSWGDVTALLESDCLVLRGEHRISVKLADLTDCAVDEGRLKLVWNGGCIQIELGATASKWADKIKNPRSLPDKLGIKPGMSLGINGDIINLLASAGLPTDDLRISDLDILFVALDSVDDLGQLATIADRLKPSGVIWTIFRKGKLALMKDTEVISAARSHGLIDTKVARFSATHTALKLVIPKNQRPLHAATPPQ